MAFDALSQPAVDDELTVLVGDLYEQYSKLTCAYLYSLVGEWELANDLNQELYLRLFRTRIQLRTVENRRAWIYQIATRLALNAIKRRKRFAWLPWNWGDEQISVVWNDGMENRYAESEAVQQTLSTLPADYRAPLVLFSGHGLSVREIADALEISEGAVKTRLHRARMMFVKAYGKEMER